MSVREDVLAEHAGDGRELPFLSRAGLKPPFLETWLCLNLGSFGISYLSPYLA